MYIFSNIIEENNNNIYNNYNNYKIIDKMDINSL